MEVALLEGQTDTLGVVTPELPALTPSLCRILRSADGSGENDTVPAKTDIHQYLPALYFNKYSERLAHKVFFAMFTLTDKTLISFLSTL